MRLPAAAPTALAIAGPPLEVAGFAVQLGWSPAADTGQGLSWRRDRVPALCADRPEAGGSEAG